MKYASLLCLLATATSVSAGVRKDTSLWQDGIDQDEMRACHDRLVEQPNWYGYWMCGTKGQLAFYTGSKGWESAEECKNYCEGAVWEGILKKYNAVKCEHWAGKAQCRWGYCNPEFPKSCER